MRKYACMCTCAHVYACIGTIAVPTRSSPPARSRSLKEKTDGISTQLGLCRSPHGDQLSENDAFLTSDLPLAQATRQGAVGWVWAVSKELAAMKEAAGKGRRGRGLPTHFWITL